MVDRIRYPTVSYLPFYYVFFQFLLLTIFNLQANILTTKDILSNLGRIHQLSKRGVTFINQKQWRGVTFINQEQSVAGRRPFSLRVLLPNQNGIANTEIWSLGRREKKWIADSNDGLWIELNELKYINIIWYLISIDMIPRN